MRVALHLRPSAGAPGSGRGVVSDGPVDLNAGGKICDAHAGQRREADGAPFILHSLEVALLLRGAGYDDETVAVGLLHDILEKGHARLEAISDAFGVRVAESVVALTEDNSIPDYRDRKAAAREQVADAADRVVGVFAADKLSKARELRVAVAADRLAARELVCKREHYCASLALVEERCPGHPFAEALRFELATQPLVPALAWLMPSTAQAPPAV